MDIQYSLLYIHMYISWCTDKKRLLSSRPFFVKSVYVKGIWCLSNIYLFQTVHWYRPVSNLSLSPFKTQFIQSVQKSPPIFRLSRCEIEKPIAQLFHSVEKSNTVFEFCFQPVFVARPYMN